ncbi:CheB methylesterase domain-containing protein [Cognatiyoonia sp. IB215182]|uniref:CheB methylesterase domain-containing protein n=1 Tax=Cognatiyoonia sp. IB215182 TaxID=3097353 RepID=UPI002A0CDF78|nr:CheB methylesterase domain-containing protein [Cognatiyoonia sp. IB215182]MDX8353349.1 CheB methylesterase domain-containing protein [Cognatiyoonia sp. IB215182]
MRVLVAEPNEMRRSQAAERLKKVAGVNVMATCADLSNAFNTIEHRPPHLVLYANEFTRMQEFEAMETLCRCLSVRWTTFGLGTSTLDRRDGGVDLSADPQSVHSALRAIMQGKAAASREAKAGLFQSPFHARSDRIVLIGSSTGGIDALLEVLGSFPVDCPPTLIVQHTGAAFSAGLARLLDGRVEPKVVEARDGEPLQPGVVMIAPGADRHLVLDSQRGLRCRLTNGEKVSGHRPSVDALFQSAKPIAGRTTAVILTGMGKDGAHGLHTLKRAGAATIGQDKATSLVYGMPGAAAELNALQQVLPLPAIGPAILKSSQRDIRQ